MQKGARLVQPGDFLKKKPRIVSAKEADKILSAWARDHNAGINN